MVSIGSQKIAEETYRDSIQENVFKSSSSIQLSVTGHSQPLGRRAQSSRTSLAESTKSCTTQRISEKSGTTSQTTSSTLNGVNQSRLRITELQFLMTESGLQEMTRIRNIRATARKFPGQSTSTCTCPTTTSLRRLLWRWSKEIPSSRRPSTCSSLALHQIRYVSQFTPRLSDPDSQI